MTISASGSTGGGPCPVCRRPVTDTALMKLKIDASRAKDPADLAWEKTLEEIGCGHKIMELMRDLQAMKRSNPKEKAVVFTSFAKTHQTLVKELQSKKIGVVELRGSMTQKSRARALKKFIEDDSIAVFALSLRSGACGLTLTAASRCYLMEPCTNEGTELQAMNRIHRMGQTKNVRLATGNSQLEIEPHFSRVCDFTGQNYHDGKQRHN